MFVSFANPPAPSLYDDNYCVGLQSSSSDDAQLYSDDLKFTQVINIEPDTFRTRCQYEIATTTSADNFLNWMPEVEFFSYTQLENVRPDVTSVETESGKGFQSTAVNVKSEARRRSRKLGNQSPQLDGSKIKERVTRRRFSLELPESRKDSALQLQTDAITQWLNDQTCDGNVKRRRKVSRPQRLAANERERRRMTSLNEAFNVLRTQIPVHHNDPKLSRIQTLRFAIQYIELMTDMLKSPCDDLGRAVRGTRSTARQRKVNRIGDGMSGTVKQTFRSNQNAKVCGTIK